MSYLAIGSLSILVLAVVNFRIRSGVGETVPSASLVLSTIIFVVIHLTGWMEGR